MHLQGQGQRALRVRRQGLHRHHQRPRPGGQFVLHAKALPGNPYDGHTLRDDVIDHAQKLTGCAPMSTRGTVDTMRKIHAASSSLHRKRQAEAVQALKFHGMSWSI
jgi:hypothetical protein